VVCFAVCCGFLTAENVKFAGRTGYGPMFDKKRIEFRGQCNGTDQTPLDWQHHKNLTVVVNGNRWSVNLDIRLPCNLKWKWKWGDNSRPNYGWENDPNRETYIPDSSGQVIETIYNWEEGKHKYQLSGILCLLRPSSR